MIVVSSFSSHDCVCVEKGTGLDLWVYFVLIHYWLHLLELVKSTSYVSHLKKITASTSWLKSSSGMLNPVPGDLISWSSVPALLKNNCL